MAKESGQERAAIRRFKIALCLASTAEYAIEEVDSWVSKEEIDSWVSLEEHAASHARDRREIGPMSPYSRHRRETKQWTDRKGTG